MSLVNAGVWTGAAALSGSPNGPSVLTEAEIVRRVRSGARDEFRLLIERHQDAVYSLCRRMLSSVEDARDAAQESFVKAYHALSLYKPELSFRNWILRIASNLCVDLLRRRTNPTSCEALAEIGWEPKDPSLAVEETVLQKMDAGHVEAAIAELPEAYRQPLVMKHCEDLSVKEISELLGLPEGTVKIRLFRAREILRKRLTESGFALS